MKRRNMLGVSVFATGAAIARPLHAASLKPETIRQKLKILVAGAHPDDPETGCGGTILRYTRAGHEVVAYYLTRGEAGIPGKRYDEAARIRTAELTEACRIMGARPVFGGQMDGDTEVNRQRYDEVKQMLDEEKPDIIFTHWPIDTHRDHRACSVLIYDAWLSQGMKAALYYFEVDTGGQTQHFHPTDYCDITPVIQKKHEACFVHKSQKIRETTYPEFHEKMEIFRGLEYGSDYAEAFVRHARSPQGWIP
ncbi:MAG: PIG-L family deacetylase [Bacteroidales bacterium]|nr:PIG-L family deacetylase [Bacteroidales bacterium]